MRDTNRLILGLAAGLLVAGNAWAVFTPVSFSFDAYNTGSISGQDSWGTEGFNGGGDIQVASGSFNSTQYASFNTASPANSSAYTLNRFGSFTGSETFVLQFDFLASSGTLGAYAGLGWDNSSGKVTLNSTSTERGLFVKADRTGGGQVELFLNGTSLGTASASFTADTWRTIRVEIDLGANSGAGSASVFTKGSAQSSLNQVSGLQNISLGLDRAGTSAADPTMWNTVWLHEEGPNSGLDNLIVVPEPPALALIVCGAVAGLGFIFRRRT